MSVSNTYFSCEEIGNMFSRAEKILFVGIGGAGMSALAEFCANIGKRVYGYDQKRSFQSIRLEKICDIKYYSTPDNVKGMDMVIYTNAIDKNCFEYKCARQRKIPLISRANFLGYIVSLHNIRIGIAGMHGKSTTTAMLAHIFNTSLKNPTVFCGAQMENFSSGYRHGGRDFCIFEACEYQNSFLSLPVTDAVILNIDFDHPDFFSGIDDIKKSFEKYINGARRVFINNDDEISRHLCHKSIITYGMSHNSIYRAEICKNEKNEHGVSFFVYKRRERLCCCSINFKGEHFVYDALCAFAVAHANGITPSVICSALSTFKGCEKRMKCIGNLDTGAPIFEDYAHHPKEIMASLSSLRQMGYSRALCVFQSHTYSRTFYLYDKFTAAFKDVSRLLIYPIFPAREENVFELSEEDFARDCGGEYIPDLEMLAQKIKTSDCDVVIIMGAGDLCDKLKKYLL